MVANLRISGVITLLSEIGLQVTVASHNKKLEAEVGSKKLAAEDPKNKEAIEQAIEGNEFVIKSATNLLQLVKSGHIENAVNRLSAWNADDNRSWDDLFTRACTLRDAIRIEFKEVLIYAYPKEKGQKLSGWEADWKEIHVAFPDVRVDSFGATDCYALGHNTASVFHSMRVAEIGLRALANERRIKLAKNKPLEWGAWQEIIKALDDEIKLIGAWKPGHRKDGALDFYSGARADLNAFKDEYRNLVMHVRKSYDENQAARALARVHEFMGRLAAKIDHRHHRIKWGRSS
jgi:hypothetical protein